MTGTGGKGLETFAGRTHNSAQARSGPGDGQIIHQNDLDVDDRHGNSATGVGASGSSREEGGVSNPDAHHDSAGVGEKGPSPPSSGLIEGDKDVDTSLEILKTLQAMSPKDFAAMMRLGTVIFGEDAVKEQGRAKPGEGLTERKMLWSGEMELEEEDLNGRKLEIPGCLLDLLESRTHLPLTMLTTSVLEDFLTNPGSIKWTKVTGADGKSRTVVDVGKYPLEPTLPHGQFNEAWENLLVAYAQVWPEDIMVKWRKHKAYLMRVTDWEKNYESTLLFDIEIRRKYLATRRMFDGDTYAERHRRCVSDVMLRRSEAALAALANAVVPPLAAAVN
ncbi:hypothetical protein FPV67DRAFT_1666919 [Lyophyllum atratum]|nr:hypothetical protein FPV67DRAFT_1666919 [Lyophyllum atratum]